MHSWSLAGCGRAPGFLKLFYEKCVYLPIYLSLFVDLHKLTHMSNFSSGKFSLYTRDKGPINPTTSYCTTYIVSFGSKMGFFSKPKSGCGDSPQTSSLDFIVGFYGVL